MDARTSRYHEVYAYAQRDPQGFWGEVAHDIDWYEPAKKVFDPNAGAGDVSPGILQAVRDNYKLDQRNVENIYIPR